MKVAIDISPVKSGHRVRGIGNYTKNLIEEFRRRNRSLEFIFFEDPNSPPPADIIHYPYFDLFTHSLPNRKTSGRVVTIHDVIPLIFPNHFPAGLRGYINLFFQKAALKSVDAVICDSMTSARDVASLLSFPEEKIHVVYLAPQSKFRKIKNGRNLVKIAQKHHLPKNFVLYVGDVNWNKNIQNLLEAVSIAKVNLVMVGKALIDPNLLQTKEINQLIKKLHLQNKITKTGYTSQDDLIAVYNLADLTVLPSFYEGFGLPVLESMNCATPVVCSNIAPLTEITDSAAVLCDPVDPKDIADKILLVLNLSNQERNRLSQKSQKHASKFTWQKVATETIKVYQEVAE